MLFHNNDLQFKIISVSCMKNEKGKYNVAGRSFHALAYRKKGTASFCLPNGEKIFSSQQDVFFLPAGMGYTVEYTEGETITVHFESENSLWSAENYDFTKSVEFYGFFENMLTKWRRGECIYEINALFYQLLAYLRKAELKDCEFDNFYKAVAYMNGNFTDSELNIEKLCFQCGISPSNFRLKFVKSYGEPPIKYLTRLRVEYAVRLLSLHSFSIERVAEESGFFDSKYFSRVIKKYYGCSPLQLSKRLLL